MTDEETRAQRREILAARAAQIYGTTGKSAAMRLLDASPQLWSSWTGTGVSLPTLRKLSLLLACPVQVLADPLPLVARMPPVHGDHLEALQRHVEHLQEWHYDDLVHAEVRGGHR